MNRFSIAIALGLAYSLILPLPGAADDARSGFQRLDQVAAHYDSLRQYRDHGTLERIDELGNHQHLTFEMLRNGDDFELVLRLDPGASWRRIWRRQGEVFEYESGLNQFRRVDSLTAALAGSLGEDGFDALVVPLALAGSREPFLDVDAASFQGEGPCISPEKNPGIGPGTKGSRDDQSTKRCRRLILSRSGGFIETELWIDDQEGWIHRAKITKQRPAIGARKVSRFDLPDRPTSHPSTILMIHHIESLDLEASTNLELDLATLPENAEQVDEWRRAPSVKAASNEDGLQTFSERITVRLVRFRIHAVDRSGRPLQDLTPADFDASWGKLEIPVTAVDWVNTNAEESLSPLDRAELKALNVKLPTVGRRVVIFVQSAFETIRKSGHRRLLLKADRLLDVLGEQDQIAVVSFDSHLKLWLDWSQDREAVGEVLNRSALEFGATPRLRYSNDPDDLSTHWDRRAAKKTASPERALELTAHAMAQVPGEKLMIYLGWGLGRFSREGVRMTQEYGPAVTALEAARTSVFVLDVTDADYHSLELGLQSVAAATGGAYYRTRHFAQQAIKRLGATLSGHYVVTLDGTALSAAQESFPDDELDLRLLTPKSEILGPPLSLE